jgi:hypothetical protein
LVITPAAQFAAGHDDKRKLRDCGATLRQSGAFSFAARLMALREAAAHGLNLE